MRHGGQDDEWEVIGRTRTFDRNGTEIRLFEFRGGVTGTNQPVLILTDGWDVFGTAERYPPNWRNMGVKEVLELFLPRNQPPHD
jgi:hypothetical protein